MCEKGMVCSFSFQAGYTLAVLVQTRTSCPRNHLEKAMSTIETMKIGNTRVLRNPSLDAISDRQLKDFAPTIFAKAGMPGVSEKYGFVNTKAIIDSMRDHKFEIVEVRQSQRRDIDRMPFTKHMLKFRPAGLIGKVRRGDVVPQVMMLNSHDRSSGFHLYAAMFRLVCENGLLVSDGAEVTPVKVHHTLRMVQDVTDRSLELIKCIDGVYRLRSDMMSTLLTPKSALTFARQAVEFRPPRAATLAPETLLIPRRKEDDTLDLWHVFNRVQENMLRGGNETTAKDGRVVMTRGIGRIERDVEVNTRLWSLAVQTIAKASTSAKRATAKKTDSII
jgi:Domain of unknown function (DUF932)